MAKALNTGDALYTALSHLFCVDDDNTVKELKAGLACAPHANVLLPGTGSSTSPVGRSFRTGGGAGTSPVVYGVDFPNYVASNGADLSFFCAVNQYNSANNGGNPADGAPMFSTDSAGLRIGEGMQFDPSTGKCFHNNVNGRAGLSGTLNTAGSISAGGVKSFGFTRTAGGVVKVYINGVVDSAYTGGIANTGSQFGAAWTTAEMSLIGGMPSYGWVSFDYAYICDWLGAVVSEAEMLRLHNSLTGSDAFALITLPADSTAPTLTSPTGTGGTLTCSGSVTTDEANGTLYAVVTASATAPTAAQVKLGQDHTGAAALRVVSQAVSATGAQTIASGSVTAGTRYLHFMHEDSSANQSAVSSSASFVVSSGSVAVAFSGTVPAQSGTVGSAYTTLSLAGYFSGTFTPFAYSVFSGSLPPGLSLNTSTGQITGTPTTAGSFSAVVRATDTGSNTADTGTIAWTIAASGAATSTTLSGPTSGTSGAASTNFTVGANGTITGTVVVTPSDGGAGGTFAPTTVSISSGSPTGTFTYTPASTGVKSITLANSGGLANPGVWSYTSNSPGGSSHVVGPAWNNTLNQPWASTAVVWNWLPAWRGGSALPGGATVGSGVTDVDGFVTVPGAGPGVALLFVQHTAATDDDVMYQAFAS